MSILKTTILLQMLVANKVLAINKVDDIEGGNKSIQKCKKLSKTTKLFKSRKLANSKKKLLKSGNLSNFDVKMNALSNLTPNARTTFNRLWLAFIKALIL